MPGREKRQDDPAIPDNLKELLNEAQRRALSGIRFSGWELRFLRRPLFQEPVLVLHNPAEGRMGILDKDGKIKLQPNIKVREPGSRTQSPASNAPLIWTK